MKIDGTKVALIVIFSRACREHIESINNTFENPLRRRRFRILLAYRVIEVNEKTKRLRNTRTTHSNILVTFIKGMQSVQSNMPLRL